MLKTIRKKRPPLSQLREAALIARKIMEDKGIQRRDTIFDLLSKDPHAPILPGIYPYIPHKWVIEQSRIIIGDSVARWIERVPDEEAQENAVSFFRFVVKRMEEKENQMRKEYRKTDLAEEEDKLISDIFSPWRKYDTAVKLKKFIVDSFACAVIAHTNEDVESYVDWFIHDWTPKLFEVWKKKEQMEEDVRRYTS
jgi:hypothetical protein